MREAAPSAEPSASIRILIVDDHRMFADTLVQRLGDEPDLDVVATAADLDAARRTATLSRPHIILLDLVGGEEAVAEHIGELIAAAPIARVIVLTGRVDEAVVARCIAAGCHGFLTKERSSEQLVDTVRRVAAGERVIQPSERAVAAAAPGAVELASLSRREREVLELLGQGHAAEAISKALGISRNTARAHIQHVLDKLGVRSQLEAVALARRAGWL